MVCFKCHASFGGVLLPFSHTPFVGRLVAAKSVRTQGGPTFHAATSENTGGEVSPGHIITPPRPVQRGGELPSQANFPKRAWLVTRIGRQHPLPSPASLAEGPGRHLVLAAGDRRGEEPGSRRHNGPTDRWHRGRKPLISVQGPKCAHVQRSAAAQGFRETTVQHSAQRHGY